MLSVRCARTSSVVRRDQKKDLPHVYMKEQILTLVHNADAAKKYKTVVIRTVDSDVVVLAVYAFAHLVTSLTGL